MDYAALTAPIPGAHPAGVKLPFEIRTKLEEMRKETEANKDDPFAAPVDKKAEWAGIVKLASDTLSMSSKDLEVAVRFVEALAKQEGFPGLLDGLKFLNRLLTDCWDRIHPLDVDLRDGPILWLCERESGAWFPGSIRKLPLVKFGDRIVGRAECEGGSVGGATITKDNVEPATPQMAQTLADCLAELETLDGMLLEKMSQDVPSVAGLRESLKECQTFLSHVGGAAAPAPQTAASAPAAPVANVPAPVKEDAFSSRADMYRLLAKLADNLAKIEPHSPIPDLLRWAVKLGNMPFRDLIKEFVREPAVLAGIRRQFGIKNPGEPDNG